MIRRQLLLVTVALFLGFLCDATVWGKTTDFAFPAFIFFCLILGPLALLLYDDLVPARQSYWLFPLPIFFAFTAFLTANWPESLKYNLSLVFTFLFIGLLTMTYLGGQLEGYSLSDYLRNFFRLAISIIVRPIEFIWQLRRDILFSRDRGSEVVSDKYARRIGFWLLAALVALFCLADIFYRELLNTLIKSFIESFSKGEVNILRLILWSWIILGFLLYAAERSWTVNPIVNPSKPFKPWLNYNLSAIVYGTALFSLATYTVSRYFYTIYPGTFLNKEGFPFPVESRFGFWALMIASGLVFVLIYWLNQVTVFEKDRDQPVHMILNILLFSFVLFLLWMAWQNVSFVTAGIHIKRHIVYARASIFWLESMFILFIVHQIGQRERDFLYKALWVTTGLVAMFVIASLIMPAL